MNIRPNLLILGNDVKYNELLNDTLTEAGYQIVCTDTIPQTLRYLREEKYFVVLISVNKPTEEYLDLLKTIKQNYSFTEVVFIVKWPNANSAYTTSLLGASDFLARTPEIMEYVQVVDNIFKNVKGKYKNSKTPWMKNSAPVEFIPQIIGETPKIKSVLGKIDKVANSDLPVLLLGETGVGKELVAQLIHKKSLRKDNPFIVVNCAAVPETLLENELFGHEKGAFTNATNKKSGLIEEANSGTLFLDEIGDLNPVLQAKLLRVVETGQFRRLGGGGEEIRVDVRIISATNKDLYNESLNNKFRSDLYYRLAAINIIIPPLRKRKEDIPLLVEHFLKLANKHGQSESKNISSSAMRMLMEYNWPGNIRELKNCIGQLVVLCEDNITPGDIAETFPNICSSDNLIEQLTKPGKNNSAANSNQSSPLVSLEEIEKKYIEHVFELTDRNHDKTAEIIGISSQSLYNKLQQYGIIKTTEPSENIA